MGAWAAATGVVVAYNTWARRTGRPYACTHVRRLPPEDKALGVAVWAWIGWHLFVKDH